MSYSNLIGIRIHINRYFSGIRIVIPIGKLGPWISVFISIFVLRRKFLSVIERKSIDTNTFAVSAFYVNDPGWSRGKQSFLWKNVISVSTTIAQFSLSSMFVRFFLQITDIHFRIRIFYIDIEQKWNSLGHVRHFTSRRSLLTRILK